MSPPDTRPPLTPEQRAELALRLARMESALQDGLSARDEAAAAVELDQTRVGRLSRMDALQQQAQAQAASRRATLQLQRVRGARQRLQSSAYGLCLDCEAPLDFRRLNADPCATLCLDCQTEREAEARRRQMQARR